MIRDTLLIVTSSYPIRNDGSEAAGAFVADMAEALARHCPVKVVAPGAIAGSSERTGDIHVRRYAAPGQPLSLLSPTSPSDWPSIARTLHSLKAETLAAAADGDVAHTLAFWALPCGWAAAALKNARGVPYSVWALGSDIWSLGRYPLVRQLLRKTIRSADQRYADGLQLADDASRIGGVPVGFLPSTRKLDVPEARVYAIRPPYRLLFLGRWHPNKGVDLLLDSLDMLEPGAWSLISQVHIAGGGPLADLVFKRVSGLQASGRPVRLSGFLDRQAAGRAFAEADYLLLPSRIESIPVIFSDAMKAGLPVICTPVGDLPRLVKEGRVGRVAEAADPVAFAAAVASGLREPPSSFGEALRVAAKRFDIGAVASQLVADLRLGEKASPETIGPL